MNEHTLCGIKEDISKDMLAKVEKAINYVLLDAKELMANKPKVQATKNDYGFYMAAIPMAGDDKITRTIWINALLRSGANLEGIRSAERILG